MPLLTNDFQKMAIMMKKTKSYYWMRLPANFFDREEIKILESQQNGKEYVILYLKLMLRAINSEGELLYRDTQPYTPEMLYMDSPA